MLRRLKSIIVIIPVTLMALSPVEKEPTQTEYYYNLRFLKEADEPRYVSMIRVDNVARQKTIMERGILITYKSRNARGVEVAGDFSQWKAVAMSRGRFGVWYYFLNNFNSWSRVRYKFIVDGIWIMDPKNNNREDDLNGSYVSVLIPIKSLENRSTPFRFIGKNTVAFKLHKPTAKLVALVGDFNGWNPENDLLAKDDGGYWRITKRLSRGVYRYKYVVDGEWITDKFNQNSASDNMGGVCSVIEVK
jgi:1,4-alpha-glucan branching enzyme